MTDRSGFGATRERLWNEIVLVNDAWAQYQHLYGSSSERVQILNGCARWFFALTQRALLREVILGISRLTDRVRSGSFDNLVIGCLLLDPAVDQYEGLRAELASAVQLAVSAASDVRAHRNKYIAHLDHATALGSPDAPLPKLPRAGITVAIDALGTAYNLHGKRIHSSHAFMDLQPLGGADALVRALESSERWRLLQTLQKSEEEL